MSFQNPLPPGIRQVVPDYVSDGTTLAWGFPFRLFATQDLAVFVSSNGGVSWTELNNGSDFTVAIIGTTAAVVNLAFAQPVGTLIRVMGLRIAERLTSVVNDGTVQSAPLEAELDAQEASLQELRRDITANASPAGLSQSLTAWFVSLPTTPGEPGTWWNDGGIPAYVES